MSIKNVSLLATETRLLKATSESVVFSVFFHNTDSATRTITVYIYPNGGSASDTTTVLKKDLPPKETLIWSESEKFLLDTNGTFSAVADVASKVSVCIGYKVV